MFDFTLQEGNDFGIDFRGAFLLCPVTAFGKRMILRRLGTTLDHGIKAREKNRAVAFAANE